MAASEQMEQAAAEGPISTETEKKQVEERLAIGAHVVYETIRLEGEQELERPVSALAWSGFAAGLSMGFSFIAEGLLEAHLPRHTWTPLITKLGYCMGFLIVVLGRQQLFTENTLTVVLPLLLRKNARTLVRMLRLWLVVLTANVVGTYLFALALARIALVDSRVQDAFCPCRLADCADGLATAGCGVGPREYHHPHHLPGRAR
jgi:formate/nitrite transporter FocA (FNT family)